ncbi:MAG: MMPL family transporter [Balneolaceae bacterium]|nr:MMPL family transporter [Balneolaceae bacterium]
MDKILRFLRPILSFNYNYPVAVLSIAIITAVIASFFALQLKIDTDLANLLPKDNEHVLALEKLQRTVGGESEMTVAIQSPSFADNKRFAKDLIDESLELYDERTDNYFFKRADFRRETGMLKDNALYFATSEELQDITEYLQDEIRGSKEEANPFLIDFSGDDEEEDTTSDEKLEDFEESYHTIIPSEYSMSPDSTILLVNFAPTGSKSDLTYLEDMFATYDSLVTALNPASYNKDMEVKYAGRLKRHLAQLDSIMSDVYRSFATGISSVILLVILYFFIKKYVNYRRGSERHQKHGFWSHVLRMPVPFVLIGLPLVISLAWTFGITYAVLGMLNTMTSVLFVILFGMGIDYGIHFYARYIEFRSRGITVERAIFKTYDNTGSAIAVSGLTTAFSLLVLILAQFRGFSEFGFIAGIGIILALFCMLFVLPSLLVMFEKWNWILVNSNTKEKQKSSSFKRFPYARTVMAVGLIISAVVLFNSPKLSFQYDFGKLEPEIEEYDKFRAIAGQAEGSTKRNPAYLLADNRQEVKQIVDSLRYRMRTDTTSPTILEVQSLTERFPSTQEEINEKLQKISRIRQLLEDPFIEGQEDEQLDRLRRASQTTEPVSIDEIPDYFKNQFTNREGEIGNFVIVYPSVSLADGRQSIAFKDDVGKVTLASGEEVYAASTSIIGAEMLDLMRSESPWMIGATLAMVFFLMLLSFRSIKWVLIALLPLLIGLLFLFGIMICTGIMFNLYNLVVLPAILGIGEDNGVHITARYLEADTKSMGEVLSSTGQHITIGSLTTMLGFSGLLFTNHPGLQSLGVMAVIGIGMTLLTALTFLPAFIQWLEDKDWVKRDKITF